MRAKSPVNRQPSAAEELAVPSTADLHRSWLRRRGEGDPIVMVHGFGGDLNAWRVLVAAAALPRPVLAIDLPGHGRSPAGATTFQALVAAVAAAIAAEGVMSADVVGHSLGGAISVEVAAKAPLVVRSLFLLAPAGLGPEINHDFLAGFCRAETEVELAASLSLLVADPKTIPDVFVHVTAETRARPGVRETQEQIVRDVFPDGIQAFSIRETLASLTIPVSIVFGDVDRIIPARHMAGLPPRFIRHLLQGVGHMPQIEARETVARYLADHLRTRA